MGHTLVVLAAGLGSRYGGLKQMEPVGPSGEFIIDYSVYDAARAGFDRIVFVIRREIAGEFERTIGDRATRRMKVEYAMQELDCLPPGFALPAGRKKPWGTGHALLVCRDLITTPFGVINADDFYGRGSFEALAWFLSDTAADNTRCCLVGFPLRATLSPHGTVSRGICDVRDGHLENITERTGISQADISESGPLSGDEPVSMNMWGLKPAVFEHLDKAFREFLAERPGVPDGEFFLPSVMGRLVKDGTSSVRILKSAGPWFGMTHPADRPGLVAGIQALIDAAEYPYDLWR